MSSTNDTFRGAAEKAEETASRVGNEIAGRVADTAQGVQQEAKAQMDKLSVSIREKPLQSAAIAAGLGFLFAVVARR